MGLTAPASGPGGTFNGADVAAVTTDANGNAAPVFTANTQPGTYSVIESVSGLPDVTFTLTNTPGPAAALVPQTLAPTVAGVAKTFTVTAYDQYGNLATGYRGTLPFHEQRPPGRVARRLPIHHRRQRPAHVHRHLQDQWHPNDHAQRRHAHRSGD